MLQQAVVINQSNNSQSPDRQKQKHKSQQDSGFMHTEYREEQEATGKEPRMDGHTEHTRVVRGNVGKCPTSHTLMDVRAQKHLNYPDVFPHLKHNSCHDTRGDGLLFHNGRSPSRTALLTLTPTPLPVVEDRVVMHLSFASWSKGGFFVWIYSLLKIDRLLNTPII